MIEAKPELYKSVTTIKNTSIKAWTIAMSLLAPSAFWEKAASSTGKYHKVDENGVGGQVIHVLRVLAVLEHLIRMDELTELEQDILKSAAILHDICKYGIDGLSEHTLSEHPQLVEKLWNANRILLPSCEYDIEIIHTISQHSGRWTVEPILHPTKLGKLLHVADFIASRHNINVII